MKLALKGKKEVFRKHRTGNGNRELSRQYHIGQRGIHYMCQMADLYGTPVLRRGRSGKCSVFLKENTVHESMQNISYIINKSLIKTESRCSASAGQRHSNE